MVERIVPALRLAASVLLLAATLLNSGCLVVDAVAVTGDVAVEAVKVTGKVVVTTVRVGADIAGAGTNAAWKLSQSGAVVVFQPRTGLAWKLAMGPQTQLTMAEALGASGVRVARGILVRNRRTYEISSSRWATTELRSGDVVVIKN